MEPGTRHVAHTADNASAASATLTPISVETTISASKTQADGTSKNERPPTNKPARQRSSRRRNHEDAEDQSKRRCVSTACIACRKRKSKCDGNTPACAACSQVYSTECIYDPNSDHRRKGVYKNDIDNLKTRNSTLQTLVQAILNYSEDDVPALIREIRTCESLDAVAEKIVIKANNAHDDEDDPDESITPDSDLPKGQTFESHLYNKMGNLQLDHGFVRYIGGTSNFIHHLENETIAPKGDTVPQQENAIISWTNVTDDQDLILHLLNMYFTWHYTVFTTLPKHLFYRDFYLGLPPDDLWRKTYYCSPLLVNAMLALGCHFTSHPDARENPDDSATAGDHFFREAKRLIMENDEHEKPHLTSVQALALMSMREAGCGRESRGWIYSGMSFRMACDMGLNLNAGQLTADRNVSGDEHEADARRLTFWGCYLFDKCWSNYLGRLPQLPTSIVAVSKYEAFPEEEASQWSPYTDSGFSQAHVQPARTRNVALQMLKLCEISNDLMKYFYDPIDMEKTKGKAAELKKLSEIHTRLEAWRRELPKELEPKEGGLSSVLIMHMYFQLLFIHLFRPFLKYNPATSPLPHTVSPRKLCTQAAAAISKLLRLYKRSFGLRQIVNIAVYIAHSACTIHLLNLPDKNAKRDIIHGLKHLEEIAEGWLCARRTLAVLSTLVKTWRVELPEEAATVLDRTESKFGTMRNSSSPPFFQDGLRRASEASVSDVVKASSPNLNASWQNGHVSEQSQHPRRQSVGPACTADSPPALNGTPAIPAVADNSRVSASEAVNVANKDPPLPPPKREGNAASYSDKPKFQRTFSDQLINRRGSFSQPQWFMPKPGSAPREIFGGVEQLMRDSNDWAFRDQQLASGFGNWKPLHLDPNWDAALSNAEGTGDDRRRLDSYPASNRTSMSVAQSVSQTNGAPYAGRNNPRTAENTSMGDYRNNSFPNFSHATATTFANPVYSNGPLPSPATREVPSAQYQRMSDASNPACRSSSINPRSNSVSPSSRNALPSDRNGSFAVPMVDNANGASSIPNNSLAANLPGIEGQAGPADMAQWFNSMYTYNGMATQYNEEDWYK